MKKSEIIIAICLSLFVSILLLIGNKNSYGIIFSVFFSIIYFILVLRLKVENVTKYTLYFVIFTLPFPYLIKFGGSDALTINTVLIYFVFTIVVINNMVNKTSFFKLEYEFILPTFLLFGFTMTLLCNPHFLGESVRQYISHCSGILLYFVLLATVKNYSEVLLIIKIILFTLILQAIISLLQIEYPGIASFFEIFKRGEVEVSAAFRHDSIRAMGTFGEYELIAEWFLIGTILSLALIYETRQNKYFFPLFCCLSGIVFTKSRAPLGLFFFLFFFVSILFFLFKSDKRRITVKLILILSFLCGAIFALFSTHVDQLIGRIEQFSSLTHSTDLTAIHRDVAWGAAFHALKKPTLFGRGFSSLANFFSINSFHSLYLTTIFRFGIFGLVIHLLFWFIMLKHAWLLLLRHGKIKNWCLLFFLTVTIMAMLLDEIIIEYFRQSLTIQFAWTLYALLIISLRLNKKADESIVVPKFAVRY
ncbi:MAG: hypothetical protein E3K37_12805 [Candidatus Kuenenia sp.]|nr:hypothetical protein [Candidatus Kuenenia hertensis]